jgi:hypothetical protein
MALWVISMIMRANAPLAQSALPDAPTIPPDGSRVRRGPLTRSVSVLIARLAAADAGR